MVVSAFSLTHKRNEKGNNARKELVREMGGVMRQREERK